MSLFNGLMGSASEVDVEKLQEELFNILLHNEVVESAYKVIRDTFVFTDKRLILIDKQGVTGKKTEFLSIPYRSIIYFSVETAGTFDLDSDLKIFIKGQELPIKKTFNKNSNIIKVQETLAKFVLM